MPSFYLAEATPGPDWVHTAYEALERELCLEYFGDDDSLPAEVARTWHHDETHGLKGLVLALAGDAPADASTGRYGLPLAPEAPQPLLAATQVYLPTLDNTHLVDSVSVLVHPPAQRHGVGTAVAQAVHRLARAHGRDTVVGFSWHHEGDPAEPIGAIEGAGTIPLDASSRFARSLGYELAQVERQSRLALPLQPELRSQLRAQAEAHALPTYRIESWAGLTPAPLRDGVAAVQAALSTDAPLGDVDFHPERWDAERLRAVEERKLRASTLVTTVAIEEDSGQVVALSNLTVPNARPERAEQDTTVVLDGHRGHRLGMLIKLANLEALAEAVPSARSIDTWNASENDPMLAINVALGFRPYTHIGIWQRKLP